MRYYPKPLSNKTDKCHVIDTESGIPIYDGALYGNDKPIIFDNPDEAQDYCDRANLDDMFNLDGDE